MFLTHWHDISYLTLRHCKSRASRCRNRIWQAVSGYTQKLWKQNKSNHRVLYFIDKVYLLCWHAGDCFQCKCTYAVLFISSKCIWLHLIDAACQSLFNLFMNLLFFSFFSFVSFLKRLKRNYKIQLATIWSSNDYDKLKNIWSRITNQTTTIICRYQHLCKTTVLDRVSLHPASWTISVAIQCLLTVQTQLVLLQVVARYV